jgi:hypothetical protein
MHDPFPLYYPPSCTPYGLIRLFYEHADERQKELFRCLTQPPRSLAAWSHVAWAVRHCGFYPTPARPNSELDGGQLAQNLSDNDVHAAYVRAWDLSNSHDLGVLSAEMSLRRMALPRVCA